jgi:hypothetical protein
MRIGFLASTCLLFSLLVTGCDRGPGPVGLQGPAGPQGVAGQQGPVDHRGHQGHPAQWALKERRDCKGRLVPKA